MQVGSRMRMGYYRLGHSGGPAGFPFQLASTPPAAEGDLRQSRGVLSDESSETPLPPHSTSRFEKTNFQLGSRADNGKDVRRKRARSHLEPSPKRCDECFWADTATFAYTHETAEPATLRLK
ncbi:hypothetical protein MRX96_027133 [Rhipicephalus microplus]